MSKTSGHIDKPEPRWQALLALIAVGGIYLALPRSLVVGPAWLLPTIIAVSLAPTIVAHRTGRHSFNHVLGIINNGVITIALIGSVFLLVTTLPTHREPPLRLLVSGAALWVTNVLVFALWYWRLDGGAQKCVRLDTNLEAAASFSRKCRLRKPNVQSLALNTGTLASSITFLSHSRKVQRLDLPTRRYWRGGRKCSPWYKCFFP